MTDYLEVLRAMRPFDDEEIYCIGPFAKRVSFSGQQYRAYALLHALYCERSAYAEDGLACFKGQKIAVVGCSIAGMTVAAGLSKMGAEVHIFEKSKIANQHLNNSNVHRFVHPNINMVPAESLSFTMDVPLMYWWADSACHIYDKLLKVINELNEAGKLKLRDGITVQHININRIRSDDKYTLSKKDSNAHADANEDINCRYDKIVVCTGFSRERSLQDFACTGYWEKIRNTSNSTAVCVLGAGDGGIIDSIFHGVGWTTRKIFHAAMKFDSELRALSEDTTLLNTSDEKKLEALKQKLQRFDIFGAEDTANFRKVMLFGFKDPQRAPPSPAVWHRFLLFCADRDGFIKQINLISPHNFVKKKRYGEAVFEYQDVVGDRKSFKESETVVEIRLGADHDVDLLRLTFLENNPGPERTKKKRADQCINMLKTKERDVAGFLMARRRAWSEDSGFKMALSVDEQTKYLQAESALNAWVSHCRDIYKDDHFQAHLGKCFDEQGALVWYEVFIAHAADFEYMKSLPGLNGKIFDMRAVLSQIEDKHSIGDGGQLRSGLSRH